MIILPAMAPAQEAAWNALLDLHERRPDGWTLIGGQLVHLHCAERNYAPQRPTEDADAVVNARELGCWAPSPARCSIWGSSQHPVRTRPEVERDLAHRAVAAVEPQRVRRRAVHRRGPQPGLTRGNTGLVIGDQSNRAKPGPR